jgi:hypothetical protein
MGSSRPHTYMEMLDYGMSIAPWKRVQEYLRHHPELELEKSIRRIGDQWLVTWRVVQVDTSAR